MPQRLSIILFLVLLCLKFSAYSQDFKADEGVIDFNGWDIQEEPIKKLSGEWEFYWGELLDPTEESENKSYWYTNRTWNEYLVDGDPVGAFGIATYRLHVKNLPTGRLHLSVKQVLCAANVYVNDSLVATTGVVSDNEETYYPQYLTQIVPIPDGLQDFVLTVQIANFSHRKGGLNHDFLIGTEDESYSLQRQETMLNGFEMSCFLFAALFFLTLFSIRKKDRTLLWFGLFCASIFIRPFVTMNYHINTVLPNLDWEIIIRIEYITLFLPSGFLLLFINSRFPDQSPSKLMLGLAGFSFLELLGPIFFPASLFTYLIIPHKLISIFGIGVIIWVIFKALKKRVSGSLFAGIAVACMLTSAVLSITADNHITEYMPYLSTALQMGFLLSMSLILGSKFASEFLKVEYLQETTESQKAELEEQHLVLKEKNEEITDSISYAYRIQTAILPPSGFLNKYGQDSFILYKPKDIVAGDFYWKYEEGNTLMFAVADCTGHGVPGAMVSVVCSTALNRSVKEFGLNDPADILNKTRELVIETFEKQNTEVKDGMDIALCVLNKDTNQLCFSGANNPLWIVREKSNSSKLNEDSASITEIDGLQLLEYKGSRQPIGSYIKQTPFESITLELSSSEMIYMLTDGLVDQFGGDKVGGKKLMKKPLKKLILRNYSKEAKEQKKHINHFLTTWQGDFEQTDDICILGLKI